LLGTVGRRLAVRVLAEVDQTVAVVVDPVRAVRRLALVGEGTAVRVVAEVD
jgi:hypothetical protein